MDETFWHRKWKANDIAFHEGTPNALLVRYFQTLSLAKGSRIFLPLCGKTRDIHWLLSQGYRVAGAELSEIAVKQLFAELHIEPTISRDGEIEHYAATNIDIFVGDIFAMSKAALGPVDAVYDRAALVALPADMRVRYAAHLTEITGAVPQLVICFTYDQRALEGPPFSIDAAEIERHYSATHRLTCLDAVEIDGGLKGKCAATEAVWLLLDALARDARGGESKSVTHVS